MEGKERISLANQCLHPIEVSLHSAGVHLSGFFGGHHCAGQ